MESQTIQGLAQSGEKNRMACSSTGHGVRSQSRPVQTAAGLVCALSDVQVQQALIIFLLEIKVNCFISMGLKRACQMLAVQRATAAATEKRRSRRSS